MENEIQNFSIKNIIRLSPYDTFLAFHVGCFQYVITSINLIYFIENYCFTSSDPFCANANLI